jgi:drug/metabolite transporter (DMT)-like permease
MAISFTTPLFMYLGSIIFFKEKALKINTTVIISGFILTIILIRPDLEVKFGVLIALIASLTHAIAGLLVKQISKTESVLLLMFSMVVIMAPISFFPSFYVWTTPNSFEIIFLLFTIASIATIGNFLWTKALSQEALTNLMPFEFSKLLFATILGILFFNEKVDLITIFCGTGLLCLNHYLAKSITKNEKT